MADLKPCPECGSEEMLGIDSSRDAEASWVDCGLCGFRLQASVPEEMIVRLWNDLDRSAMPKPEPDDLPGPFPSLETHPFEMARRGRDKGGDMWLPIRESEVAKILDDARFEVRRRDYDLDQKDLAARQARANPKESSHG